jgi:hypothetical protein
MPVMTDSVLIGPSYQWPSDGSDQAIARQPARSTKEYVLGQLNNKFKPQINGIVNANTVRAEGIRQIFDVIFSLTVFNSPEPEIFTIHHNDLDLQNSLSMMMVTSPIS